MSLLILYVQKVNFDKKKNNKKNVKMLFSIEQTNAKGYLCNSNTDPINNKLQKVCLVTISLQVPELRKHFYIEPKNLAKAQV